MANYTTRPWIVDCNEFEGMKKGSQFIIRDFNPIGNGLPTGNGLCLIALNNVNNNFPKLKEADAKLISAAPDLLEACKSLLYLLEEVGVEEATAIKEAKAAIIKATI